MGNRHFFPHITNFQFELCQKINTLCCQLGSCHGASPRPGEPSETFSLSLGSQLDTRTGVASCLRLWPPVSPCCVGSCEAPGRVTRLRARNTRASVELPGQDTILIREREREPVRVSSPGSSKDRSLTAAAAIYAACWCAHNHCP